MTQVGLHLFSVLSGRSCSFLPTSSLPHRADSVLVIVSPGSLPWDMSVIWMLYFYAFKNSFHMKYVMGDIH